MSAALPGTLDAWRAVTARRYFEGVLPLSALPRLAPMLADSEGEVRYAISFDRDAHGMAYVEISAAAGLPLICQRSLERFVFPVSIEQRLGLVRDEADEAALPPGWEPLLVATGEVEPAAVLEDELILAVPLVPARPSEASDDDVVWSSDGVTKVLELKPSPFAALGSLKDKGG
jgi:uncharacterized protein